MNFFFSSRRRHTRCSRDWSSDVCSSDLAELEAELARTRDQLHEAEAENLQRRAKRSRPDLLKGRSEERRVGKEGRGAGGPSPEKHRGGTPGTPSTQIRVHGRRGMGPPAL